MAENDTTDTDTAAVGDAESEAAFGSGFAGAEVLSDKSEDRGRHKPLVDLTKTPANGKAEPAQDAAQAEVEPPPEYVQITKPDWAEMQAIRAKAVSHEQQLSKAWGTIGKLQQQLNGFQPKPETQPAARKVEISKRAYAKMETDFPELAEMSREALGEALSELNIGANEVDDTKIERIVAKRASLLEQEALEDAYPDWRTIVGAVDVSRETPDPDNAFRKWLAGKDEAYQTRINGTESAQVIGRAIRTFQRETAPPAAPAKPAAAPRDTARADRIRNAVQPRGDNAGSMPQDSAEDAFAAGFGR